MHNKCPGVIPGHSLLVETVGISRCQGRLRRRCRGLRSLTAVFRVFCSVYTRIRTHLTPWTWVQFLLSFSTNENGPLRVLFIGGDGGNRTHVQEYFRKNFSERSRVFDFACWASHGRLPSDYPAWSSYASGRLRKSFPACMTPGSEPAGELRPTRGAELCSQCEIVVCFSVSL